MSSIPGLLLLGPGAPGRSNSFPVLFAARQALVVAGLVNKIRSNLGDSATFTGKACHFLPSQVM